MELEEKLNALEVREVKKEAPVEKDTSNRDTQTDSIIETVAVDAKTKTDSQPSVTTTDIHTETEPDLEIIKHKEMVKNVYIFYIISYELCTA